MKKEIDLLVDHCYGAADAAYAAARAAYAAANAAYAVAAAAAADAAADAAAAAADAAAAARAAGNGLDLGGAVEEKFAYNQNRPDHKPENRQKENGKKY